MAKKTNPHGRSKRLTGVSSWLCAHTCASKSVCVCQRSVVCVMHTHTHTQANALAQLNVSFHLDRVHLPLSLGTVLAPAHLIDGTKSELISPGGGEPTHGNLRHGRVDLR